MQLLARLMVLGLASTMHSCYSESPTNTSLDTSQIPDKVSFLAIVDSQSQQVSSLDFGSIPSDGIGTKTLYLSNLGRGTAKSIAEDSSAALSGAFGFLGGTYPGTGGTCSDTLASGSSCKLVLGYAPSRSDTETSGKLTIKYNNGILEMTATVDLAASRKGALMLYHSTYTNGTATDFAYTFANTAVAATSTYTLTLLNTGGASVENITVAAGHGPSAPFAFEGGTFPGTTGTCSSTLTAGASCTVVFTYTPAGAASHSSDFTISYSDGTATQYATGILRGTAP